RLGGDLDELVAKTFFHREAGGDKGHHGDAFAAHRAEGVGKLLCGGAAHDASPGDASRVVCRVGMSLSPRPERPTRMRLPGKRFASSRAPHRAWALSSAGSTPSCTLHSRTQ